MAALSPLVVEPTDRVRDVATALQQDGYTFVSGAVMRSMIASSADAGWGSYAASWDDLETDRFMADGGTYRKRRFACFGLAGGTVRRKPAQPHYQTREDNPLNGGVARIFAPVTDAIAGHPLTSALLRTCAAAFDTVRSAPVWHVEMHQFRIEARAGAAGLPTPEGLHHDGVDFVLTLLVGRRNVEGGASMIVSADGTVLAEARLTEPLDSYFIDDRRVMHGVSPVAPVDPAEVAHRDVLVLTFRAEES